MSRHRTETRPFALALAVLAVSAALARAQEGPIDWKIEPYKLNYGLVITEDRTTHHDRVYQGQTVADGRQPEEAKFQISFKRRLFECEWVPLYLGYTQKSFWQVYDGPKSRPFRENNYNPEMFLAWSGLGSEPVHYGIQLGLYEHESNGQTVDRSRSWNRSYVQGHVVLNDARELTIALKRWWRWSEPRKDAPDDALGDDNPEITRYLGNYELTFIAPIAPPVIQVQGLFRKGTKDDQLTYGLDVLFNPWELFSAGLYIHVQYFYGYGESLIDFDQRVNKIGAGIALAK